ncbi:MAG: enoyl-CoA hydratase-related protein [Desulfobacterales bacterium]
MEQPVLFEIKENIAIITLNRPSKRNAIDQNLMMNLHNSFERFSKNSEIRVGILTGSGDTFCAGLDLSSPITGNILDLLDIWKEIDKPIIGAINGHAITGGFELALNCDFLIASENASFADTHARMGIHPGWGVTQLLQQAVGIRMAKQISLSCQFFSARQMLDSGLVNEVVPREKLMERCMEIARDIASANQEMLGVVKKLIEQGGDGTYREGLLREREGFMKFLAKIEASRN